MDRMHAALEEHSAGVPLRVAAPVARFYLKSAAVGRDAFDTGDLAEIAGLHHALDLQRLRIDRHIGMPHADDKVRAPLSRHQGVQLAQGRAERFLDENMKAAFQGSDRLLGMELRAGANDHCFDPGGV